LDIHHETLVFEREFNAPPERLFQSFTDPREREVWSAPTPDIEFVIDETDVRTGGSEIARCGSRGNLSWTMKVAYHKVTANEQITFTEELWDGEDILTVALITFEFVKTGQGGTHLRLTDQITSFVGQGGIQGHEEGYTKALANLEDRFAPA